MHIEELNKVLAEGKIGYAGSQHFLYNGHRAQNEIGRGYEHFLEDV